MSLLTGLLSLLTAVVFFVRHCVRSVDLKKKVVSSVIGDGKLEIREGGAADCSIGYPLWIAASPVTGTVLIGSSAERCNYLFSQDKETGEGKSSHHQRPDLFRFCLSVLFSMQAVLP